MLSLLKRIPKPIVINFIIAVVALGLGAFGGYTYCKRAQYKGIINQQVKDAKVVMKHQEKKDEVDRKVEKHVEALKDIPDSSGCLDSSSDDSYLERLQRADSAAKSGFN